MKPPNLLVINAINTKLVTEHLRENGEATVFAIKNRLDINMVIARRRVEKSANWSCYALENDSF